VVIGARGEYTRVSVDPMLQPCLRSNTSNLPATSLKPVNKFKRATNRAGNSVASSNDTKPIQTNNLAVTPQPMTAALIFRRQLVRQSLKLTASSERVQAATRKISSAA
jgi:hypothetical protein